MSDFWDQRYAGEAYLFGTEPNDFLRAQQHLLKAGEKCLAVADGEGRNGVWVAQQGLIVMSVDSSPVAQAKAKKLAQARGVEMQFGLCDLLQCEIVEAEYDVVVAIFVQFVAGVEREQLFAKMLQALKSGGLLLLQGYTPRQLEYGTGGPPTVENLYTEDMLRELLIEMDILTLKAHDAVIHEGSGHDGMSALIDVVARKK